MEAAGPGSGKPSRLAVTPGPAESSARRVGHSLGKVRKQLPKVSLPTIPQASQARGCL